MELADRILPLCLFVSFSLGAVELSAQVVGGQVILDGDTPLLGVRVGLLSPGGKLAEGTETDEAGRFYFPRVSAGNYFLDVVGPECEDWQAGPLVLEEGDTVIMYLSVAENEVPDPPFMIVSSCRPWYEHLQPLGLWPFWERRARYEALGTGTFFTSADLEPWRGNPVTLTLSALSPFLQAEPAPRDQTGFLLRGPRDCTPLVFIDGHRVRQGTEGSYYQRAFRKPVLGTDTHRADLTPEPRRIFTPIDHFISLSQIAGVEVYRGASDVPAEFRIEELETRCGAVVIWSHRGPTG
jgi:hypothetical protein